MSTSESPPTRARFHPQLANWRLLPTRMKIRLEGLDTMEQSAMPARFERCSLWSVLRETEAKRREP